MSKLINGIVTGASLIALQAVVPATVSAHPKIGNDNPHNKITICHATSSKTNPYVVNAPDADGVINGHYPHQDNRDIIPPFDYNSSGKNVHFNGQNWTTAGQAIYNNGCKSPKSGGQGGGGTVTPPTGGGQGQVLGATTSSTLPAGELANTGQNAVPSALAGLAVLGMTGAVTLKTRKS